MTIAPYFNSLTEHQDVRKISHLLTDIIGLSLKAVIAGCESYDDIEEFGKLKIDWLRNYLNLSNGIPSHDTIERTFEGLNPKEFNACFSEWVMAIFDYSDEEFLHIDGKSNRCSFDIFKNRKMLHSVSVFAGKNKLSLAQFKVDEKSNEITAIEPLLERLDIKGQTVTIDAMGCRKSIAECISKKGDYYLLAVKDNQKTLHDQIKSAFENTTIADKASNL